MPVNKKAITDYAKRINGADDPSIAKHAGELFGTPGNPDYTPVEQRKASPGHVLVEWIGESGPLADERLAGAQRLGLIPKVIAEAWTTIHAKATTRVPGLVHHTMSRERDNMSQTYTWGPHPGTYIQEVTYKDAETLLTGSFAAQFRIIGYPGEQPADADPIDRFLANIVDANGRPIVSAAVVAKVRSVVTVDGETQRLTGIVNQSGGQLGAWT